MHPSQLIPSAGAVEADRLLLLPYDGDVADAVLEAAEESAAELYRYMPWRNDCLADVLAFVERARREQAEGAGLHFTIHRRDGHRLIGGIGLHHVDPFTPRAEVGYWIRSSEHRRGYATESVVALSRVAFHRLNFERLSARAAASNVASQRVLERCGFVREGFERRGELCHGTWHDLVRYGLLRTDGIPPDAARQNAADRP